MATKQRNIVLLSDGTGNSSGKLNKTNVWRLYQALDLSGSKQIAFYDDGVGTSGFKPLMLLGGIFGWGLSRNVRDLYRQLCEHYSHVDPDEDAIDHIYIFGFSRGAFTARTLAGLIGKCGILDKERTAKVPVSRFRWRPRKAALDTDEGLKAGVALAYRSYRYGYSALLTNLWRKIRQPFLHEIPEADDFKNLYARPADITFIGVWDTVAAVGLPVDELSLLVDRWIYPHRFSDQDLSKRVKRACHALAVDDERHSFHPVLWNEEKETDPKRVTQTWFPGMHADVGGGYADEDLAYIPLKWMIDRVKRKKASASGLDFQTNAIDRIESRANVDARIHDSRGGLGVYYRYKPRDIERLSNQTDPKVDSKIEITIDKPKIHHSVFDRVTSSTDGYAPHGVPTDYERVEADGTVTAGLEPPDQCRERGRLLERSKDHVFWRRIQYFLFLLTTLGIFALPYFSPPVPNGGPRDDVATKLGSLFGAFEPFLPNAVSYWFDAWAEAWPATLILAVVYGLLVWWTGWVRTNALRLSELAWWHVRHPERQRPDVPTPSLVEMVTKKLRRTPQAQACYRFIAKRALPAATFVSALFVLLGVLYRLFVFVPAAEASICQAAPKEAVRDFAEPIPFATNEPCLATGLELVAGETYGIEIAVTTPWKDASIPASPAGFDSWLAQFRPTFIAALPAKRVLTYPWFVMVGDIGGDPAEIYPLREPITIKPTITGELRLYVNDAVRSLGQRDDDGRPEDWNYFYRNNQGEATVTVTRK